MASPWPFNTSSSPFNALVKFLAPLIELQCFWIGLYFFLSSLTPSCHPLAPLHWHLRFSIAKTLFHCHLTPRRRPSPPSYPIAIYASFPSPFNTFPSPFNVSAVPLLSLHHPLAPLHWHLRFSIAKTLFHCHLTPRRRPSPPSYPIAIYASFPSPFNTFPSPFNVSAVPLLSLHHPLMPFHHALISLCHHLTPLHHLLATLHCL